MENKNKSRLKQRNPPFGAVQTQLISFIKIKKLVPLGQRTSLFSIQVSMKSSNTSYFVSQFFKGNTDTKIEISMLRPPLVADGIRLVPEFFRNTQVCLRIELLGCPFEGGEFLSSRLLLRFLKQQFLQGC